ncbi:MAG: acetate kinase, partial [Alphaproteobacteria bacterium]|nr:acetate kinase [Alphaproteobacteria bacterium]
VREIGGLIAVLGGLDALIFTAGIGENSALIRELTVQKLAPYGLFLDQKHNYEHQEIISSKGSEHPVLVIKTDEQLQIAKHCVQMFQQS